MSLLVLRGITTLDVIASVAVAFAMGITIYALSVFIKRRIRHGYTPRKRRR